MLLNVPSPPCWLQELHNCHLLPKQPKPSRKEWKNRTIYTKKQSIQEVTVYISLTLVLALRFNHFMQVLPNPPCLHQKKREKLVLDCIALFLQTLHHIALLLPPHCQTLQYLALPDFFWWSLKLRISLIHFHALFLLRNPLGALLSLGK